METLNRPALDKLLRQYAAVRLSVADTHLASRDLPVLRKLIDAASWIDRIYWKQRSEQAWRLAISLSGAGDEATGALKRLLSINYGPWDHLNNDQPFWGKEARPPGGTFYPPDLSRGEFDRYVIAHPQDRQGLQSHTTLVRRQGDRLAAIAYHDAYREELAHVAQHLREAAELATHLGFAAFLRARASGLVTGSLRDSERLWVDASDSPIDIAIGPFEMYDDGLLGLKAAYEATVMIRHPLSERLAHFKTLASDLAGRLPGAVAPAATRRNVAIGVYDVACAAGMANMGAKAIAATLPNDEQVRVEHGARLLLFRNVIAAKFGPLMKPLAERVMCAEQRELVREDAFLYYTLLHEMAHALTPAVVSDGQAGALTVNEALRERYSTIEECRADLIGMVFLDLLAERNLLPADLGAAGLVTFIIGNVRALRFGGADDHGRAAAIIMSKLLSRDAVTAGSRDGLAVNVAAARRTVLELAGTLQEIANRGDYRAAGDLIANFGANPPAVARQLATLNDIPVDVEFVFDSQG